jgi:hypothetical protein
MVIGWIARRRIEIAEGLSCSAATTIRDSPKVMANDELLPGGSFRRF